MGIPTKRTATSVTRRALALIGVLCAVGVGAVAVHGASAAFTLAASPSSQIVTAGQAATYTVTVTRNRRYGGGVSFAVTGLPANATASFAPATTTAGHTALTVLTNWGGTTPAGTSTLTITAVGARTTQTTTVTLVVAPATQPGFTLTAAPSARSVVQSDSASYAVSVTRTGGFTGPVSLSVAGAHNGTVASFAPNPIPGSGTTSTITLDSGNTPEGSYAITVTGSGTIGSATVTRAASVTFIVAKNQRFTLAGDAQGTLAPGRSAAIDVAVTNPHNWPIKVTSLTVSVEQATSRPACGGSQNFEIVPYYGGYPLTVPAGSTRTLSQLGIAPSRWPKVRMKNAAGNQEACKDARLTLQYSGAATK